MPEAGAPLKSLEEIKLMFQRLSFYSFSTPQIKGSPRNFTSKLFARGKTGSFTFNSTDGSDPTLVGSQETCRLRSKVDLLDRGDREDSAASWSREDLEDPRQSKGDGDEGKQKAEDPDRDVESDEDSDDELLYEAESPDEAALVHAARAYRCTLRGRSAESLLVDLPGIGSLVVQLLHILPFDSNRKRMSVVVRHPLTGQVVVYTKGADSVIMDLAETQKGKD